MFDLIKHTFMHTLEHSVGLIPFLFLTYLAMEYLEHKAGEKTENAVKKAGKLGPLFGGIVGIVPQCGFSAAASNLYAGRVISKGTLLAIYLSTSDEMLPIMISSRASIGTVVKILVAKVVIAVVAGFVIDLVVKRHQHVQICGHHRSHENDHDYDHSQSSIYDLCKDNHCQCEKGIFRSAVSHTVQITVFVIIITFALQLVLELGGEDILTKLLSSHPIVAPLVAGVVGLIPNCASSVAITQLYLNGTMSAGAMMSGLLVSAGMGLPILFRMNHSKKETLQIIGLLYLIGVLAGIAIGILL